MRQGIAIVFATLMLSVSCRELVHFAIFKLNQDYITRVFCINKDKPELKCDGKCYLRKSIDANEEEKKSNPVASPDEKSLVFYYVITGLPFGIAHEEKSNHHFRYFAMTRSGNSRDIPHPPEGLS